MSQSELQIESESIDSVTIVTPVGDVDLSQSDKLRQVIKSSIDGSCTSVIIDLAHVNYMDSSGVATLIEGLQLARMGGKELSLCALNASVEAVLQLSKLDQIFDIYADRERALES